MRLMAIMGSARPQGNTSYLVDLALEEAARLGIDTEKVILCQHPTKPCLAHENCGSQPFCLEKDEVKPIIDRFISAEGIILASPAYFLNVSAQLKAFLDRHRFLHRRRDKIKARCAGLIAVAARQGTDETLAALRRFLPPISDLAADHVLTLAGYGDVRANEALAREARQMGQRLAEMLLKGAE